MSAAVQLRAGDPETIGGYTLQARLGAGGMGTVFLAHTPSGRPVAIKLIHQQLLDDDEFRTRFRQEVAAARRVSGAFTAAVIDADPEGDHPWMATTYISGPTLAQRISEDGTLCGAELRTLAIGLVEALRDIHRAGVVHRDLKPSNVVLSPDGPRVIDFGISRAADQKTLTMTGRIIGTPPFMSPEQLQAPREVGTASDVFSVATLLVYAATGQGPFDADSPYLTAYQVVHEAPALDQVPEPLRAVVERCLDKDRWRRPDADELLEQLRGLPSDLTAPPGDPNAHCPAGATTHQADAGEDAGTGAEEDGQARQAIRAEQPQAAQTMQAEQTTQAQQTAQANQIARAGYAQQTEQAEQTAQAQQTVQAQQTAQTAPDAPPTAGRDDLGDVGIDRPTLSTRRPTRMDRRHPLPVGSGPVGHSGFPPRVLRRRWRTVVAVAAAVAVISTGVTLLASGGAERHRSRAGSGQPGKPGKPAEHHGSVTVAQSAPPKGFRPWQTTVRNGEITEEVSCVPQGDSVYCGGGGVLAARLKAADGTRVWQRSNAGVPAQGVHFAGVADGTVIGYRIPENTSELWHLVGMAVKDGRELWSAPLARGSAVFTGQQQEAQLLGSTVFLVDADRTRIEARQAHTGNLLWSTPFPADSACVPLVAGAQSYAMCAPWADLTTGNVAHPSLRTLDPVSGAFGRPAEIDGHLCPIGVADDGSLVAVKERRGGTAFTGYSQIVRFDPHTGRVSSSPLKAYGSTIPGMAGGILYLSESGGLIHAVDPATGTERWSTRTNVESLSGPVLAHGVLYFSSASGRVIALAERDGRLRYTTTSRTEGTFDVVFASARVAVAGGALIVTARGNTVFSFAAAKPPTGP